MQCDGNEPKSRAGANASIALLMTPAGANASIALLMTPALCRRLRR